MARAYSLDLRARAVASVTRGKSCRTAAALFDVSMASVVKWSKACRCDGNPAAKPMAGKRPYLRASERDWLLRRLSERPDLTLHALLAELRKRGSSFSAIRSGAFCAARGSALERTVFATERDRPDVARRRAWWKRYQARLEPEGIVLIARNADVEKQHIGLRLPRNATHVSSSFALRHNQPPCPANRVDEAFAK